MTASPRRIRRHERIALRNLETVRDRCIELADRCRRDLLRWRRECERQVRPLAARRKGKRT